MSISELIYKLVPEKMFERLQRIYHQSKKKLYPTLDEAGFEKLMDKLNIRHSDVVFVHSSIDKINSSLSPIQILELLKNKVGDEGTLLFPSWSYSGRTEDFLKSGKMFDVRKSFTRMGLLPEMARRIKAASRSEHPTASIAAIGKHASDLTDTHHLSQYACDENSPYYKMMTYNAKIIGLGEKPSSLSFVHCVEDVMRDAFPVDIYYSEPREVSYRDVTGKIKTMKVYIHNGKHHILSIPGFMHKHVSKKACHQFKEKGTNYFTADANTLFEEMKTLAQQNITIYD